MSLHWKWAAGLVLTVATFAGNGLDFLADWRASRRMGASWEGRAFRGNGVHSDLRRELVEQHVPAGAPVFLLVNDGQNPSPMTRIIHQTLSWCRAPDPVRLGPADAYAGEPFILTAPFNALPDLRPPSGGSADLTVLNQGPVSLWRRRDSVFPGADATPRGTFIPPTLPPWREARGLAAPLLAFLLAFLPVPFHRRGHGGETAFQSRRPGPHPGSWQAGVSAVLLLSLALLLPALAGFRPGACWVLAAAIGCGVAAREFGPSVAAAAENLQPGWRPPLVAGGLTLAFLLLAATMTLHHTFLAPNGLGVHGGKARIFYLADGIPAGFFTEPARRTLQPAYPPGLTLLTLACYGLAGGCGEHLTQLLPVALSALVLLVLMTRNRLAGGALAPWLLAVFLARTPLRMTTQFYAEPLMALLVLAGWEGIRGGQGHWRDWVLLGAAGWVKNEGVLFPIALWIGLRGFQGGRAAPWHGLAAGLLLPLGWHLGCRLAGAELYDFAPVWSADPAKGVAALQALVHQTLLRPWRCGYVFPLALLTAGVPWLRRRMEPSFRAAALAVLLLALTFAGIFALSEAAEFNWHLASLKRLLWVPAMLLIREWSGLLTVLTTDLTSHSTAILVNYFHSHTCCEGAGHSGRTHKESTETWLRSTSAARTRPS